MTLHAIPQRWTGHGVICSGILPWEVASQLAERGVSLSRDAAKARCRQLAIWGNLMPSIRDARVATVAEIGAPHARGRCPASSQSWIVPSTFR